MGFWAWVGIALASSILLSVITDYFERRRRFARAKKNLELLRNEDEWGEWKHDPCCLYVDIIFYLNRGQRQYDELKKLSEFKTKIRPERIGTTKEELLSFKEKARKFKALSELEDLRNGRVSIEATDPLLDLRQALQCWNLTLSDIGTTEEELAKLDRQARIQVAKKNLEEFICAQGGQNFEDFYSISAIQEAMAGTNIALEEVADNEEELRVLNRAIALVDDLKSLRTR